MGGGRGDMVDTIKEYQVVFFKFFEESGLAGGKFNISFRVPR